jgi:ubiquinone/menaquinone biosynthesis C-methylase UbiE
LKPATVYKYFPGKYARLKSYSDYSQNTIKAINGISPIKGKTIVELGVGTGNIAFQLTDDSKYVYGFDLSRRMLNWANRVRRKRKIENCLLKRASHEDIPIPSHTADVIIIGWALVGYVAENIADGSWKAKTEAFLKECERIAKPKGYLLIIETANILRELPVGEIFHPVRKRFLDYLVTECHFRTVYYDNDWDFQEPRNIRWARFWFGKELTNKLLNQGSTIMQECAGIWWKQFG